MGGVLDSGSNGLDSNPGRVHFVAFLGRTLYCQSASLHRYRRSSAGGGVPAMD